MTEYCTIADLEMRFGADEMAAVTDRSDSPDPIADDDVLNAAISDASAVIDGALLDVFVQPVAPFSNVLVLICCDIARWMLYDDSLDVDGIIQRRYDRALSVLANIADGSLFVVGLVKLNPGPVRIIRA